MSSNMSPLKSRPIRKIIIKAFAEIFLTGRQSATPKVLEDWRPIMMKSSFCEILSRSDHVKQEIWSYFSSWDKTNINLARKPSKLWNKTLWMDVMRSSFHKSYKRKETLKGKDYFIWSRANHVQSLLEWCLIRQTEPHVTCYPKHWDEFHEA